MTLVQRPGTEYRNRAELMDAWNNNHDFHTADIMSGYGHATTKRELEAMGRAHGITIRYGKELTKVIYIP